MSDRAERATVQSYLNARLLRSGLRSSEPDVNALLSSLEGNAGSEAVVRHDGRWFAGSVGTSPDVLPSSLTEVVSDGEAGRQIVEIDEVPHVVVGVHIAEMGATYYELLSLEDIDESLAALARGLAVGAVIATAMAAVAGWYASGRVLRPLRRMATAVSGIADGSLDTRLDAFGDRGLEPIQYSFNRMADAVEDRIEREHVRREPRAALTAGHDAVVDRDRAPEP